MSEEEKGRGVTGNPPNQYYYGTFQGVSNYYPPPSQPQQPPHLVYGFPQPVCPHGATANPPYYYHGYQSLPTAQVHLAIMEGRPMRESRLPCCGMGMGWFLFIAGFFLGGIPWYVGAVVLLCAQVDYREKPGYVACVIASILAVIAVTFGITKGTSAW